MDWLYDHTPVICLACPSIKPVKRIGSIEEKQERLKNVLAHLSWTFLGEEAIKNDSAVNFEISVC